MYWPRKITHKILLVNQLQQPYYKCHVLIVKNYTKNIAGEPTPTTLLQMPCIGRGKLNTNIAGEPTPTTLQQAPLLIEKNYTQILLVACFDILY